MDSTAEHAENLANLFENPAQDAKAEETIAGVAARLCALSASPKAQPLEIIRLRGGIAASTPTDPSSPAILLCTLPMYGSRLLFRGYGSRLRPVDAAMAGTDSLVLLDEAHLAPHLQKLLPDLADCTPNAQPILPESRARPMLVALTATGNADENSRFDLDDKDRVNPVVAQRLAAAKPLELREGTARNIGKQLADATLELLEGTANPSTFLVFANMPATAREAFDALNKSGKKVKADVLLLTGRMREREAQRTRDKLLNPESGMSAGRDQAADRERHLIVVATQTLEVGADLDAEYLITEQCGVRALTQRLGRLNRLGQFDHAKAIYLHTPEQKKDDGWPVYEKEPETLLERLKEASTDDVVNLSPEHIADVLGVPEDNSGEAPEIMPEILREWTKTTTPPEGEAPVEPYFSGMTIPAYRVSTLWRIHVPAKGDCLWPRPAEREIIDIPIREVREALKEGEDICRLAADGITVEVIPDRNQLKPGDCLVLPSDRGLMDEYGWNPGATGTVVDVSLARHGLPLDLAAIKRLCEVTGIDQLIKKATGQFEEGEEIDQADRNAAAQEILEAIREAELPDGWEEKEWSDFLDSLRPRVVEADREASRLLVAKPDLEPRSDDFDERTIDTEYRKLDTHCQQVATRARAIARQIGLPDHLSDLAELAAKLHDVGKADKRFQRWLAPEGETDVPLAKSNAPRTQWEKLRAGSGWPRGGRHEALSARLLCSWIEQNPNLELWNSGQSQELLTHLVISHHGKGRPLVSPVADDTESKVTAKIENAEIEVQASLGIVDWEQPRRFRLLNEHFGPWGLALMEAVVIRADHAVSGGDFIEQRVADHE